MHKEKLIRLLREEGEDELADRIENGNGLTENIGLNDSYSATVTRADEK